MTENHIKFENLKELDFKTNEAFKALRTNISFCGDDVKTVAFTSSAPNEGKSSISFRLACSFAEDEKKVLFIDADIRKSVTTARYAVDTETVGLTHYLAGKKKMEEIIYSTSVKNLDAVFTGKTAPNPSELLGGKRFAALLEFAKEHYDYVIVDCPPLGSVIDAAVVARQCDGAVIVAEAGTISRKAVYHVKKQLNQASVRILGVVLNKVEAGGKGYGKGYYRGYGYGYGYGYGEKDN